MTDITVGSYETEDDAKLALDRELAHCKDAGGNDLFWLCKEVCGAFVQPRPCQNDRTLHGLRIDRLLLPSPKLRELGWEYGAIGIEVKKSGVKIGPAISQAIDYSRAVWTLPDFGNIRVWLDWIFIWPMVKQHGPIASVLAQNRIGSASSSGNAGAAASDARRESSRRCG